MPLPLGYFLLMNTKYFKMLLRDKIQFFNLLGLQLQKYSISNKKKKACLKMMMNMAKEGYFQAISL